MPEEKKILILTYYWFPSGGAGVQRILKFVKYLPQFGIKPYIVTVKEEKASYPSVDNTFSKDVPAEAEVFRTDTAEPFEIYSKMLGKRSIPTGFSNESSPNTFQKFSRFVRGNLFIPDARKGWIKFACEKAGEIIEKEKINIMLSTSPPHSTQIAAMKLKRKFNLKWIADLRDPWTDIYFYNEFRHTAVARRKDLQYERNVLEAADRIITVSEPIKKLFIKKSDKVDPGKIFVIPNGFDPDDFRNVNESLPGDEFVITYTGTIADSYKPQAFFKALRSAIDKIASRRADMKLKIRFVGNLSSAIHNYLKEIDLEKYLEMVPTVSHEQSINYLLESTVLLLVIPEVENNKGILTGKLFEYLASGKPVICIGPKDGAAAEIIEECNAGKTFERHEKREIADYLEALIGNWEEGKLSSDRLLIDREKRDKFSRYEQTKKLVSIINGI